jgi:hypothetical protein
MSELIIGNATFFAFPMPAFMGLTEAIEKRMIC